MNKKQFYRLQAVFLLSFFYVGHLLAQNCSLLPGRELSQFLNEHPAENVYLHTDRDIYSVNDSIWFRIYLTNAQDNTPQPDAENVYVELIDTAKNIRIRNLILTYNGVGKGDFNLGLYHLNKGKYQLRAYSNYQRNFGDSFFFRKNILLTNFAEFQSVNSGSDKTEEKEEKTANPIDFQSCHVDLQFLPESGYLSYGCPCNVAFIARDVNNQPIEVSGWILNEKDEKIVRFLSIHDGMGKFTFFPEKNVVYKALLDNFPGLEFNLPVATDKIQFSVDLSNDSIVSVALQKFEHPSSPENYYLVCSAKGKVGFFTEIRMTKTQKQIKLKKNKFESGINKLTLADSLMRPVAERLVFVKRNDCFTIDAFTDREEYGRRAKVNVEVKTNSGGKVIPASLSVSVVNKAQVVPLEQYPQNIQSYLLLDSELHGTVHNPSYYFKDDSVSTLNKLDLVMQTNGWRNYNWDNFKNKLPDTTFMREEGLAITGKIKKLLWKHGINEGKITLLLKNKAGAIFANETYADSSGFFRIPPSFFPDSVEAFLKGENKYGRKNSELINISTFQSPAPVTFERLTFLFPGDRQQSNFKWVANLRLSEDKAYNPGKYEIMLDEVNVIRKLDLKEQSVKDGHLRIYGVPDNVLKVDKNMTNVDIWSLMTGQFAGVIVSGNNIAIRGIPSRDNEVDTPLFLLDGIKVEKQALDDLPVSSIDKIEVLKSVSNLAIFGSRGANGVIAVYTKHGENVGADEYYKGIISEKLRGYYLAREFYSPDYDSVTGGKPDHRTTIYWNPEVKTDSAGVAKFSFFTTDDPGFMMLKVEGLSYDGKPGVGFLTIPKTNNTPEFKTQTSQKD